MLLLCVDSLMLFAVEAFAEFRCDGSITVVILAVPSCSRSCGVCVSWLLTHTEQAGSLGAKRRQWQGLRDTAAHGCWVHSQRVGSSLQLERGKLHGLMQDWGISGASAMETAQFCTTAFCGHGGPLREDGKMKITWVSANWGISSAPPMEIPHLDLALIHFEKKIIDDNHCKTEPPMEGVLPEWTAGDKKTLGDNASPGFFFGCLCFFSVLFFSTKMLS